jgi:Excalibur calcium-binding domain
MIAGEETQMIRAFIVAAAIGAAAIGTASTVSAEPFFYENCDAAREAGAAPVYEDEPGYGPHLDRDRGGIGCE